METNLISLTSTGLVILLVLCVIMLIFPRRIALISLFIAIVLITIGQQVTIAGAHFTVIRIIIFVGWIRVVLRGGMKDINRNKMDIVFLYWVAVSVIIGLIPKNPHPDAVMLHSLNKNFISMSGFAYDALGVYFLIRCFIRNTEDIIDSIRILIGLCAVVACFMTLEMMTGRNIFSVFGAVPEWTGIRDGRLRCQGPFTHPIHAGNFGATLVPLCIGLWFYGKRKEVVVGVIAGSLITWESASSGPLMAYIFGIIGFPLWKYRENMQKIRWGFVALLISLELFMKSHVWYLMDRIADIIGGGGYWRAKLIDLFVIHFSEWWLVGTKYTKHWSPTGSGLPFSPDMMDITNKFIWEGVSGGLLRLIFFIAIIVICYKRIGQVVNNNRNDCQEEKFLFWSMGCALFSYIISFLSVSSSAQTDVLYYCLLAFIGCQPKETINVVPGTLGKLGCV